MRRRDSIFGFDLTLFISAVVLLVFGVLFIYSSAITSTGLRVSDEFIKQMIWAGTGLGLMFAVTFGNYARARQFALYIYAGALLLILWALLFGKVVRAARSWIGPAGVGVQPSEFAKLATILLLAAYLSAQGKSVAELPRLGLAVGIVLLPVVLIVLQPDIGTALAYVPILLVMLFFAGSPVRHLLFFVLAALLTVVLSVLPSYERIILRREFPVMDILNDLSVMGWIVASCAAITVAALVGYRVFRRRSFYWMLYGGSIVTIGLLGAVLFQQLIRPYQIMRFIIFLDPTVDPLGAGWNIMQSETAVGSGGLWGKGFLQGTQSHLRYLPEQSTDFIFSIIAEEWGFVGGFAVIVLLVLIILRGIRIAYLAKDEFGRLVAAGVVAMLFFHAAVNIGMAMGVMPITGIPLYLLSYGGSSTWTVLIALGLLQSIYMRRY